MLKSIQLTLLFALVLGFSFNSVLANESNMYRQGMQAFQQGHFSTALDYFQQEKNKQEKEQGAASVTLYFNLGSTHYRLGNYDQAASYFAEVSEDDKWGALAEYNLGLLAERQEKQEAALAHYRQAIDQAKTDRVKNLAENRIQQLMDGATAIQKGFIYLASSLGYDDNLSLTSDDPELDKVSGSYLELLASGQFYLNGNNNYGNRLQGYLFARKPNAEDMQTEMAYGLSAHHHRQMSSWQTSAGLKLSGYQLDSSTYTRDFSLHVEGRRSINDLDLRLANELKQVRGGDGYEYLDGWQNQASVRLLNPGSWQIGYQNELNQREDLADELAFYSYSPIRHSIFTRINFNLGHQLVLSPRLEARLSQYPDQEVDSQGNQESSKRRDLRWRAAVHTSYRLTHIISLFAELQHLNNNSNLEDYDYSSNQLAFGIDAIF